MTVFEEILHSSSLILPEWVLFVGIIILTISTSFSNSKRVPFYIFGAIVLAYLVSIIVSYNWVIGEELYSGLIYLDKLSLFIKQLAAIAALIFMVHARLFNYQYKGEIYLFILFVLLGISFLSMTTHFLTMYVSLELISLSSYILVASNKLKHSFEAAIKYLIFGATASAVMLFGISLFYGISQNLNFASPAFLEHVSNNPNGAIQVVSFMVLAGFLFKIAAAPFHNWVPDVYEVTSTPIISFLSFAPKAAGFVVIARLVMADFTNLSYILAIVAAVSLVVGNFAALWQNNFKRMLGYSGIAQSGFILIGLIKFKDTDFYGTFFYLASYLPITMGVFLLADLIHKKIGSYDIPSYAGLGKKYPILSINAFIILISLVGIPPTIGFLAKLVVFSSLADTAFITSNVAFYALLIFGLLNAAVSLYYYLRPAYYLIIKDSVENHQNRFSYDVLIMITLSYISLSLLYFFFNPDFLSNWVKNILPVQ